jgi:BolA protein
MRTSMATRDIITEKLSTAFTPQSVEVVDESHQHAGHAGHRPGGETHFRVYIVADAFKGKSRLERHRMKSGKHTRGTVAKLQAKERAWLKAGLASFNQRRVLEAQKLPVDIPYGLASRIITHVKRCRWNPGSYGPRVRQMLNEGRQPGED